MIVSNKWTRATYASCFRQFLSEKAALERIVDLAGLPVFQGATVRTVILLLRKSSERVRNFQYHPVPASEGFATVSTGDQLNQICSMHYSATAEGSDTWSFFSSTESKVLDRLVRRFPRLGDVFKNRFFRGVVTGLNDAFVIDKQTRKRLLTEDPGSAEIIKPVIVGRDVRRYQIDYTHSYLIFARRGVDIVHFPAIKSHLSQWRADLTPKKDANEPRGRKPGTYRWYEIQDTIDYWEKFSQPKIVTPDIATSCRFTIDYDGYYGTNTTYFIESDCLYLLGILNSSLAFWFFRRKCAALEGPGDVYLRFFGQYLQLLPFPEIDSAEKSRREELVKLVEQMLAMHKKLASAKAPHDKTVVQGQIDATDRQIDRLVYELFGLTEEEIRIVEGANQA